MPALGSACGRRGPYPTVLGRPAPSAQAHYALGPGVAVTRIQCSGARSGVRASRTNGFAPVGSVSRGPGHSLLTRGR
jgi:hypothetical protein